MSKKLAANYLSFEQARDFVQGLNLSNYREWIIYAESSSRPANLPKNPYVIYMDKGWVSFNDFIIGDNTDKSKIKGKFSHKDALPFEEARAIARNLGIVDSIEWSKYFSVESNRLKFIPMKPNVFYKNKGWQGWQDWLDSGFLSFEEAREYCKTLGLIGSHDWFDYASSGRRPKNIPSNPRLLYKSEWLGWRDFLSNSIKKKNEREGQIAELAQQERNLSFL